MSDGKGPLNIVVEVHKGAAKEVRVLKLQGYLDVHTVERLSKEFDALFDAGLCRVVVDLKRLTYMGSIGFGVLAQAQQRANKLGGDLKVSRPTERVRKLFDSLGLAPMLEFHESVEAALAAFPKS
ncbi:MAG: STAS domain-containing protein [Planctomycetes bacterium]|nr:STAS domain-containing protein [Planctomycetota bacterium]MBM4078752.1 STAS domain-containing protein [Planctomycetota bacterium]MBM4085284.1 STAS domain-containing protein [Planctomycetota bacterium]